MFQKAWIWYQLPSAFPLPCRRPQFANNSTDDPEKSMASNLKSRARGNENKKASLTKGGPHRTFFVTLLNPADAPNTFELVARNLKMKARGNRKSNEANQIKSSRHDTENHQQIVQHQPQIDGNRGLDWSWGLLGEAWEPFGLPRPSGTEKRSQMTKKWPRLGSHVGVHFRYFPWFFDFVLRSFSSLHFDGYQDRCFMDFDHFFGLFLEVCFISFRIVGK